MNVNAISFFSFFSCLYPVIRAKVVGKQEVDVGNDVYGDSIKRLKYDIKQIKVFRTKLLHLSFFFHV